MQTDTLAPVPAPLDRQAAFNRVYTHFVYEGGRPSVLNGRCAYRGEKGARCAAGILLPDSVYDPKMDSAYFVPFTVWMEYPLVRPYWGTSDDVEGFVRELQRVHDEHAADHPAWPQEIELALHDFARAYKLTLPPHPDA